jgi:tetratricopeptide (TPR) repeat protein
VPLYIEELTRSVVETETVGGDEIPETLQASLLARLDRLGTDAKEVAQLAAVIGREFGGALLGAVSGKFKDEVDRSLQRLVASEIVLPTGPAPDGAYAFRHALIQDAAYQSLLLSRRRQYHGEIASALERQFPEVVESQPDLVARHYTAADAPQQAIPYWLRAGKRALARYAIAEPIAYFERGLEQARRLPEAAMRSRLILDLLLSLGDALFRSARYQASLEAFKEAADFAQELQSVTDLADAAVGAALTERDAGGPERESLGLLEAALRALGDSETPQRCRVLSRLGRALFSSHLPERATQLLRDASNLARRLGDRRILLEALICERITTSGRPCAEWQFSENREALQEMLAIAEEIGDPQKIGDVLNFALPPFLEMADRAAYDGMFARYGELIEKHPTISVNYSFVSNGALRAILDGEFPEAEGLAEKALELGQDSMRGDVATGVYGVQMFTIRREQGRLAEVVPVFRRFLDQNPQDLAWRPGLALIASDLGFKEAARKAFENLATEDFAFPIDAKWSLTVSYLAEVCAGLGDVTRAEKLYDLLLPYRDVTIIAPTATVCCGSAARYLGMLASVIGDWPSAEEHFEAALAIDERLEAWPWLAHTQYEFATALLARGAPGWRRADGLLAAAAETAQRLGMTALQQKIRSHAH